ncbi:MAG: HAD-IB family hydrolase [Frankiales bacterium]|nr:HAD-IB family hydrolase [Frankiales bacterium]
MARPHLSGIRRRKDPSSRAAIAGVASAAVAEVEASLAMPADPSAAAFFDVDNTMMQGASIYHFARGLAARDFFTWRDLAQFAVKQISFRIKGVEDLAHMEEAKEAALAFVAGHEVAEVVALGEEIYDELMADRIWSGTRALAQLHLDAGQRVWLVTAAPTELASLIARRLGLTGALGTVAESKDGIYTGRLVGEPLHGPAKAEAIRALAEREGLDLSRCAAYSDSANDVPMLSLVGDPVAVNPDHELKRIAKENGWKIRDFRTGRKAARVGLPAAAGMGAVAGGVAVGLALRRRGVAPVSTSATLARSGAAEAARVARHLSRR